MIQQVPAQATGNATGNATIVASLPQPGAQARPVGVINLAEKFESPLFGSLQSAAVSINAEKKAAELIRAIQEDVSRNYQERFGQAFDRLKLGVNFEAARQMFLQHEKFDSVLELLNIDLESKDKIRLPWWSEICLVEIGYEINDSVISTTLKPEHSYHIQLIRAGINPRQFSTVSVSGLLVTEGTEEEPDGFVALGLRGGSSFPNTYHLIAGTARFEPGHTSMQEMFKQTELHEEVGLGEKDYSVRPVARFVDLGTAQPPGDVNYFYKIKTLLGREQLKTAWTNNQHPDKTEHTDIVFIPNTKAAIQAFILQYYRGIPVNDINRTRENAELLHPAALALIAYAGLDLTILQSAVEKRGG